MHDLEKEDIKILLSEIGLLGYDEILGYVDKAYDTNNEPILEVEILKDENRYAESNYEVEIDSVFIHIAMKGTKISGAVKSSPGCKEIRKIREQKTIKGYMRLLEDEVDDVIDGILTRKTFYKKVLNINGDEIKVNDIMELTSIFPEDNYEVDSGIYIKITDIQYCEKNMFYTYSFVQYIQYPI